MWDEPCFSVGGAHYKAGYVIKQAYTYTYMSYTRINEHKWAN